MERIKTDRARVVEGRDDVAAVSRAVDALIIPTHGFGITAETWQLIEKAYNEKGLIILTDPDFSGEEIRRKLTARFPDAVQAYVSQGDATAAGDIGVENACPEVIAAAVALAIENERKMESKAVGDIIPVTMSELIDLGLAGTPGSGALREAVCAELGIGHGNGKALVTKLAHWGIGIKELEQTVEKIRKEK